MPRGMPCKSCGSINQKKFSAEMAVHFAGLKTADKPIVWVFSEVLVCLDCGMAEFSVPIDELRQLKQSDPTSE
jgi:hypothetical protein